MGGWGAEGAGRKMIGGYSFFDSQFPIPKPSTVAKIINKMILLAKKC